VQDAAGSNYYDDSLKLRVQSGIKCWVTDGPRSSAQIGRGSRDLVVERNTGADLSKNNGWANPNLGEMW